MKYLPYSSLVTLCLPENIAASMELGSPQRVSIDVSKMTPPTESLTIFGKIPLITKAEPFGSLSMFIYIILIIISKDD